MRRRTFFLLIALLLGLFLVARLAAGRALPQITPRFSPAGVTAESVRARLTRPLTAEQIAFAGGDAEGCRLRADALLVADDEMCIYALTPSSRWTRRLSLRLAEGEAVELLLEQENALDVEERLEGSGATIALDIYRKPEGTGARLTVADCTGTEAEEGETPAGCRLQIE